DGAERRRKEFVELDTWALRPNITADGRGMFVHGGEDIIHIDFESGARSKVNDEKIKPIAVIAGVGGTAGFFIRTHRQLHQRDAATRRTRRTFELPTSANGQRAGASGVSVSPDGKQVVVLSNAMVMRGQFGTFNGSHISLYDAETGALRRHWLTTEATLSRA